MHTRVLSYWFGGSEEDRNKRWWEGSAAADAEIAAEFGELLAVAASGGLQSWIAEGPKPCLALIVVLDQFSLQVHRDLQKGYDVNALSLPVAREAIARGYAKTYDQSERMFSLLPFMHAEDLDVQRESVVLFKQMDVDFPGKAPVAFAIMHLEPLEKHGRFPGRNKAYGRQNTPAEEEYFANGGFF